MEALPIRPMPGKIVVKRIDARTESPGGILLPESEKDKSAQGLVVAVGVGLSLPGASNPNGSESQIPSVKVGDGIIFNSFISKMMYKNEEFLVMTEKEILVAV